MSRAVQGWLFLIVTLLAIVGAGLFGALGYMDTSRIVDRLSATHEWETAKVIAPTADSKTSILVRVYAALELDTLQARHERAATQLATRTWLRFLTTLFGAILIVFGAAFVLGRVTSGSIEAGGQGGGVNATLKTTSPGLILAVLGVFLMAFPLWASQEITTWDGASFGSFTLAEGPDGPIATVGPRVGGVGGTTIAPPSAEEVKKLLDAPATPEKGTD